MISMETYISPFDFKEIILNLFLGHPSIIAFGLIILISTLSAKYQMSNRNFMMLLLISSIILSEYLGEAIYIIILVIVGFVVFKPLSRVWQ